MRAFKLRTFNQIHMGRIGLRNGCPKEDPPDGEGMEEGSPR